MTVDLNSPVAGTSMSLDDEFDEQLASRPHASAPASATTPATRPKRLIMVVFFIWFEPFLSLHRHSSYAGAPAFKRKRTTKHAKTDPRTHEGTVHLCRMQNGAAHAAIQKAELCETVQNSISALRLSYPLKRISQMLFLANGRIRSAGRADSPHSSKTDDAFMHVNRMVAVRGTRTSGARPGDRMHFVEIPRVPLAHLRAPKEPSWISK